MPTARTLEILVVLLMLYPTASFAAEIVEQEKHEFDRIEWSKGDTQREAAFLALVAVDWYQTSSALNRPDAHESNPILGERPSQGKINTYILAGALAHVGASYLLPAKWRRYFQNVSIGLESVAVGSNYLQIQKTF